MRVSCMFSPTIYSNSHVAVRLFDQSLELNGFNPNLSNSHVYK